MLRKQVKLHHKAARWRRLPLQRHRLHFRRLGHQRRTPDKSARDGSSWYAIGEPRAIPTNA